MRLSRFSEFGKKIVCVGKNYKDHAIEMGGKVPDKPIIFIKPSTAYITEGHKIQVPQDCKELHHEVELGVIIEQKGSKIPIQEAMCHVGGYAICLDMTARDLQAAAKKDGLPWELSKGFDTSCPVGSFIPKDQIDDPHSLKLWCKVNGNIRQTGQTGDMIFRIPQLISYISGFFTLEPGDLILTGTPAGVSAVKSGDVIEAGIGETTKISFTIA